MKISEFGKLSHEPQQKIVKGIVGRLDHHHHRRRMVQIIDRVCEREAQRFGGGSSRVVILQNVLCSYGG